jgi:hypothetical protein
MVRSLLTLVLCSLIPPAFGQSQEGIRWLDNYQQALAEAKQTKKPIFLEFRCEA